MKTLAEIHERIEITEKINSKDFDLQDTDIPERDIERLEISGDEWPLLFGYTPKAIEALEFTLGRQEEELELLQSEYKIRFADFLKGNSQQRMNPYIIVERLHALSWALDKCEWGDSIDKFE